MLNGLKNNLVEMLRYLSIIPIFFLFSGIIFSSQLSQAKQPSGKVDAIKNKDIKQQLSLIQMILDNLLDSVCADGQVMNGIDSDGNILCTAIIEEKIYFKHVFLSSQAYDGNLGGVEGADAKCQALADASDLPPGIYKAWISDQTSSPSTRFLDTAHSLPYVLPDEQTLVAVGWSGLTTGDSVRSCINMDETGQRFLDDQGRVNAAQVWTNTTQSGETIPADVFHPEHPEQGSCNEWRSAEITYYGEYGQYVWGDMSQLWTDQYAMRSCDGRLRLYCFEQ